MEPNETMTKSELIEALANNARITKGSAEMVVESVFDCMTAALCRGDDIDVRGFGRFSVRKYRGYVGRSPRDKKQFLVHEKRLPFFKVGKDLRVRVDARTDLVLENDDTSDEDTDE